MNLVTTGLGDIHVNAKEKINFDLFKSDMDKNNTAYRLLTGPTKHFFLK